eukprot:TRINITY_DN13460_c0_g1_i1.p1 TRINITY_DN13460_c0_g1~~TRINITY_DN13460_c0_g1_i1.p1  ORF type:complete len:232 (+),score=82.10 TRINITY_DN13460_c0_g1_i1:37-696(+)
MDEEVETQDTALELIAEYLDFSGYNLTLQKLAGLNLLDEKFLACPTMEDRKQVTQYILEGNIKDTLTLIAEKFPRIMGSSEVMFDLHLLEFVELVRSEKLLEALFVSRDKLHPLAISEKKINTLRVAMTAIASRDPLDSPASFMFRDSFRHEVSLKTSGAILQMYENKRSTPALRRLLQQFMQTVRVYRKQVGQELSLAAHGYSYDLDEGSTTLFSMID